MREIVAQVLELLDAGQDFALVRLLADSGSTPRAAGAEMLVRRDGSIAGTIGGGLLELAMMKQAQEVLRRKQSLVTRMGLAGRDITRDDEMVCGGAADVLIAYVPPGDPALTAVCREMLRAMSSHRSAWLFTVLPSAEGGDVGFCLLNDDDTVIGLESCEPGVLRAALSTIAVHGSTELPDGNRVAVEVVEVRSTVIICGAGHVGRALAPVALGVGFSVTVIDDREEFVDPRRFPGAEVVFTPFDEALSGVDVGDHSYIVILTHGHAHDMAVLAQALRTPARYIGLMASRNKRKRMEEALLEAGFREDDIGRIHSPVGLAIDAETPAELATSIVAEMIQVRAHGST